MPTTPTPEPRANARPPDAASDQVAARGQEPLLAWVLAATFLLIPVTLPVAVLRPLVQERFGAGDFATALFMSANMIGALLFAPIGGALADRYGRPRLLITTGLVVDALAFLAMTADVPLGVFLGLRFVQGCAHITTLSVLLGLAASGTSRRGRTLGLMGAGMMLGVAIGAPLGGWLGAEDPLLPLRVAPLILLASLVATRTLPRGEFEPRRRASLAFLLSSVLSDRNLRLPFAFAFADRFTVGFLTTAFPLYMSQVLGAEPKTIGLLLACFLFPFAGLSYPLGRLADRDPLGKSSVLVFVLLGSSIYGLLLSSLTLWSRSTLPVLMLAMGLASAVMFVPSMLLVTNVASPERRSSALGGFNAAGSLGFLLGPLVAGSVLEWWPRDAFVRSHTLAFVIAGASQLACVAIASARRWRRAG